MKMTVIASVELSGSKSQAMEAEITAGIHTVLLRYGRDVGTRVKYPPEWVVNLYSRRDSPTPRYTYKYATYGAAKRKATEHNDNWYLKIICPNGEVEELGI